jgi:hypothetical protein
MPGIRPENANATTKKLGFPVARDRCNRLGSRPKREPVRAAAERVLQSGAMPNRSVQLQR